MRHQTITVYPFAELSERAQQRAADWVRQGQDFDFEWECLQEDAKRIGLRLTSWEYGRSAGGELIESAVDCAKKILKEHGKDTRTYQTAAALLKDAKQYDDADDDTSVLYDDWRARQRDFLHALLEDYRSMADQEYEHQQSDAVTRETIEANGYEFTEDGKIV